MRGARPLLAAVLSLLALCLPARATPLVADLSDHLVAITTGFAGAEVLLFGAVEEQGDVVVVVRGPDRREVVYRKSRVAGIWMNTARMRFAQVPSFYAIASSRPLEEIAEDSVLRQHKLGVQRLKPQAEAAASANIIEQWRQALIRTKQAQDLFISAPGRVSFLGERLFRTTVYLPPNVPVGLYRADIFLFRDGQVVSAQTTPLNVFKAGLEAELFAFAHDHSVLYGLIAVVLALVAGWLAHLAFRRT